MTLANLTEDQYFQLQNEIQGGGTGTGTTQQAATTIVWNDEGQQPTDTVTQPTTPAAPAAPVVETAAAPAAPELSDINDDIKNATPKTIQDIFKGKTDNKIVQTISYIFGGADSGEDAVAGLLKETEKNIRTLEDKRRSVKLLALGLALLGGQNSAAAAQIANQIGSLNDKRIDSLYARRKTVLDAVQKKFLKDEGFDVDTGEKSGIFGDTYKTPDGKYYFKHKDKPGYEGPGGVTVLDLPAGAKKTGVHPTTLPARLQGQANKYDNAVDDSYAAKAEIVDILADTPDAWSGSVGRGLEGLKNIFGSQNEVSEWRRKITKFTNTEAIRNLPAGPASDKDIDLVKSAQVNGFANEQAIRDYLAAVERLNNYTIRYNEAKRDHIYETQSTHGFKAPKYDPEGADIQTTGVTTSSDEIDFDFSQ